MKPAFKKPLAESEILDAALYYETERIDLGLRFVQAIQDAVEKIEATPGAGSTRYAGLLPNLRMFVLQGFPYLVFYLEYDTYIDILRVLHAHRDLPAALNETSD